MSRWLRPILAIIAVGLAVWQVKLLMAALGGADAGPSVETATAKSGPFVVGFSREGTLESANVAQIKAPRSGSTLAWLIEDGAMVKAGDLIARVDVSEYRFEVDRQRLEYQSRIARVEQERRSRESEVESAQLNVEKLLRAMDVLSRSQFVERQQAQAQVGYDQWNLNWATGDYQKRSRLSQEGIVPQTDVVQAERVVRRNEFGLDKSEKRLDSLDAQHSSKKAQMEADVSAAQFETELARRRINESVQAAMERAARVRERLDDMEQELASGELRAPQAGVVVLGQTWDAAAGRRTLRTGDRVWWGMDIASITDLSDLKVALRVDEASAGRLRRGQEAIVHVVGAPDREFRGEISSISAVARRLPPWEDPNAPADQRVFDVQVKVLKPDERLCRPGVKAKVQFVFERLAKVVSVPVAAVFDKPEGQVVYVATRDGFEERRVKTGQRNDEAVVILEGVKAGERVALSDPTRAEGG